LNRLFRYNFVLFFISIAEGYGRAKDPIQRECPGFPDKLFTYGFYANERSAGIIIADRCQFWYIPMSYTSISQNPVLPLFTQALGAHHPA
jgi:hypothetical protein